MINDNKNLIDDFITKMNIFMFVIKLDNHNQNGGHLQPTK